ncbi:phosphate ABC transporter permease subunit PstC [Kibdelosporangium phytohabitans]|uniref:Phosphate transport system permease protein n=1 Tax=Kibdelosporangium phytohabitans TaxID=860235 RepID=A0A0N9HPK2_9PSEU|nr:phosphate ABC transporter permease subunit PstC [Kibdelosporangium phytohabitans]ALG06526.1 phosphate ABC transporter permease [Kibdelosporangium phytohabitans]MBE1467707.1 phosphate transport system permease protein [Kibdelosporangium phytohabitans]
MTTQADRPRPVRPSVPVSDRVFRGVVRASGAAVLVIMGSIGIFLAYQAIPTLREFGWVFFTEPSFVPDRPRLGIAAVGLFTLQVAGVAIVIAFPLAVATALYISEYAPARLKRTLIALLDLMAAIPSVVYGLFGFVFLTPQIIYLSRWLSKYLGFLPFFDVKTDVNAAAWEQSMYTSSPFIAGFVVAMMVLPFAAAIMREVFAQAPLGEREGALALGSTRWGVIRSVVLPFGKGGIIGGSMLALGRALGETIAVVMILAPVFDIRFRVLENGGVTISSLIALRFGEATPSQLSALLAAGLMLFLFTLAVNTVASTIVARTRSGSATEI